MKDLLEKLAWPLRFLRSLDKYVTIMIVPHRATKSAWSFNLKERTAVVTAFAVVGVVLVVGVSFLYASSVARRLIFYQSVIRQTEQQSDRIEHISKKTEQLDHLVRQLDDKEGQIRKILGLPVRPIVPAQKPGKVSQPERTSLEKLEGTLEAMRAKINSRRESIKSLLSLMRTAQERFSMMPSRWPLYGPIGSYFGYRVHPWRGFHSGIDIRAPYGSPVRATANGVVSYSGWRNGYGKLVEIYHGFGLSTLYGHNSKLLVREGARVRKGQVVALVGLTGWTTGPHCHYEVRTNGVAMNPLRFMNLTMLTAARVAGQRTRATL